MTTDVCQDCNHSVTGSHLPRHRDVCIQCSPTCKEYTELKEEIDRLTTQLIELKDRADFTSKNSPSLQSALIGEDVQFLARQYPGVNIYTKGGKWSVLSGNKLFTADSLHEALAKTSNKVKTQNKG